MEADPKTIPLTQQAKGGSSTNRRLFGRVAWISGATSGIGEATARLFAREGAKVAIIGQHLRTALRIARSINNGGGEAVAFGGDISSESIVRKSVAETAELFGGIDIVVNNAGIVGVKCLHEYTIREWDRVMDVNVKSGFLAFKHAFPYLRRQRRSWVVNVGSVSSFVGQRATPVYTTSKHAIMGLTKSLALDYAEWGIRCNCICPGITDTPMLWKHLNSLRDPHGVLKARLRRVPMGVALTPADVARSILFLSCDDSFGVTGTSLVIDGGYLAAAEWEG